MKWEAFKEKLQKDNREALNDYLKGEDESRQRRTQWEAELFQARLRYNEEVARQNLDDGARVARPGVVGDRDRRVAKDDAPADDLEREHGAVAQQGMHMQVV